MDDAAAFTHHTLLADRHVLRLDTKTQTHVCASMHQKVINHKHIVIIIKSCTATVEQ